VTDTARTTERTERAFSARSPIARAHRRFLAKESKMQLLLLVGSIVLSVGAALGTASLFLSLLLRIMSKLR